MSSRGPPLLGMTRIQKLGQWQQDVRPWLPAILTACLLNLLLIIGVSLHSFCIYLPFTSFSVCIYVKYHVDGARAELSL